MNEALHERPDKLADDRRSPVSSAENVRLVAVESRRHLRDFLDVSSHVYAGDSAWVKPLSFERKQHFSARNAYFRHARWQPWVAYRDGRPVGRISAQIDDLHLETHQDATGFFGMLEAEDDAVLFQLLTDTALEWLRERGMRRARGPFNLSINQECGLLVEGFDEPPVFMMGHARPYASQHLEAYDFVPAQDLLAYRMRSDFSAPAGMRALVAKAADRIRVRSLRRGHRDEDLRILRDIFNDAWSENWGFVPFTEEEFLELGRDLLMLTNHEFVQIAEVDGEPAAMLVALPNINELIRDLDGRLFPLGWLRLLWRLKRGTVRSGRVTLMGVRKRHQQSMLGTALALVVIEAIRAPVAASGIEEVELSWILESNRPMANLIEALGGVAYKRYRIYEKAVI